MKKTLYLYLISILYRFILCHNYNNPINVSDPLLCNENKNTYYSCEINTLPKNIPTDF